MSDRVKIGITKYAINILICGMIAWYYISVRDFSNQTLVDQYRILCDALTIPGILSLIAGAMVAISNEGFFYGISYAVGIAVRALIPGGRLKTEKYYDYVERKRSKRITGFGFLYVVGGVFLIGAVVFMVLFYQLY